MKIHCVDQSSSDKEDRGSSPSSKSSSSRTKDDKFEEMWEKMGAEIKSAFLTMLLVTPECIVFVSNPEEIVVDEDESEIILQLLGCIAAKRTRRESWQRFRQRKEF